MRWRGKVMGYRADLLFIWYADIIWTKLFIMPGIAGSLCGWAGPIL